MKYEIIIALKTKESVGPSSTVQTIKNALGCNDIYSRIAKIGYF